MKHDPITKGKKYGNLTAISIFAKDESSRTIWVCQCDCGKIKNITDCNLKNGTSRSCGCSRRLAKGQVSLNRMFDYYKRNASKKGIGFYLSKLQFASIVSKNCRYCGSAPKDYSAIRHLKHITPEGIRNSVTEVNGIDRLNNNQGYSLDNSVPCCSMCNMMKKDLTEKEFLFHVAKISNLGKIGK